MPPDPIPNAPPLAPGSNPPPPPPPTAQPAGTSPPTGPQPGESGIRELGDGRVQILSSSAYKRIKEHARKQGRTEAMRDLDAAAQAAGFRDASSALETMRNLGDRTAPPPARPQKLPHPQQGTHQSQSPNDEGTPPTPPTPPHRGSSRRDWERYERQRQQFERDRNAYRERISRASQKNRELQRRIDAQEAEMVLRETAVACGVKDIDYAMRLLTRSLEGKSEAEIDAFDERKFFEELRASKPYLFGETATPAHTGNGGEPPPAGAPPTPGRATTAATSNAQIDARKMSREEFADRLKRMGLNPPSI